MIVLCPSYRATPDGNQIRLEIDSPKLQSELDPNGTRLLYVVDVAKIMRKSVDAVYRMGTRKRNPIPFTRGNGRPYVVEATLARFLSSGAPVVKAARPIF